MRVSHMAAVVAVSACLVLSGCSDGGEAGTVTGSVTGTGSGGPSASVGGPVREVVREIGGKKFEISVRSLASDGEVLELSMAVKLLDAGEDRTPTLNFLWGDQFVDAPSALRIVDFDAGEVLPIGRVKDSFAVNPVKGSWPDVMEVKAYYAAPSSDRVRLMLPMMGMIEDLEVTRAEGSFVLPEGVDELSGYVFERCSMERIGRPYESEGSVSIDRETVTIAIPSDILFEFGKADLTETAAVSIASVQDSIRVYGGEGKLTVVGHTDDQGSAEAYRVWSRCFSR